MLTPIPRHFHPQPWPLFGGLLRLVSVGCVLALALPLALPAPLAAEDASHRDKAEMIARGSLTFQVYCTNCHGKKGKGDGKLARLLTVKPADLTLLSARRGGTFPAEEIHRIIDGRKGVAGHGMRDMPIWGDAFVDNPEDPGEEARVQTKIDELVLFLEILQDDKTGG